MLLKIEVKTRRREKAKDKRQKGMDSLVKPGNDGSERRWAAGAFLHFGFRLIQGKGCGLFFYTAYFKPAARCHEISRIACLFRDNHRKFKIKQVQVMVGFGEGEPKGDYPL